MSAQLITGGDLYSVQSRSPSETRDRLGIRTAKHMSQTPKTMSLTSENLSLSSEYNMSHSGLTGWTIACRTGLGVRKTKGRAVLGVKPKFPHVGHRREFHDFWRTPKTGHLTRDRSTTRDGYGDPDGSVTCDRFHRKPGSAL